MPIALCGHHRINNHHQAGCNTPTIWLGIAAMPVVTLAVAASGTNKVASHCMMKCMPCIQCFSLFPGKRPSARIAYTACCPPPTLVCLCDHSSQQVAIILYCTAVQNKWYQRFTASQKQSLSNHWTLAVHLLAAVILPSCCTCSRLQRQVASGVALQKGFSSPWCTCKPLTTVQAACKTADNHGTGVSR